MPVQVSCFPATTEPLYNTNNDMTTVKFSTAVYLE